MEDADKVRIAAEFRRLLAEAGATYSEARDLAYDISTQIAAPCFEVLDDELKKPIVI